MTTNSLAPQVAGLFYPDDSLELTKTLKQWFSEPSPYKPPYPKAVIVPHAGYQFSGKLAAYTFACLQEVEAIKKVIILAPAHRYLVNGIACSKLACFTSTLGEIKLDQSIISEALKLPFVNVVEEAFYNEHAIEVQLPFIQTLFQNVEIIPFLVGRSNYNQTYELLRNLWAAEDALIVISSDLSHFHPYAEAQKLDSQTINSILDLSESELVEQCACGIFSIGGLMKQAKDTHMKAKLIKYYNSGDCIQDKQKVVGYAGFHFFN